MLNTKQTNKQTNKQINTGNLAFKRSVTLSSTKQSHSGALAVDGDENTWAETERGKRDWLQIDFGGIVPVSVIEILPKPGSTLQNFWIFGTKGYTDRDDVGSLLATASFALFDPIDSSPDPFGDEQERLFGRVGAEEEVPGFPSRKGTPWLRYFVSFTARYIRIQANGSLPLEIAEVRVYRKDLPSYSFSILLLSTYDLFVKQTKRRRVALSTDELGKWLGCRIASTELEAQQLSSTIARSCSPSLTLTQTCL